MTLEKTFSCKNDGIVILDIIWASKYGQKYFDFKTTGKPGTVVLTIRKLRQEGDKFKVSLSWIVSSRPAWATWVRSIP